MDARAAIIASATAAINADTTLTSLIRGGVHDVRDPSRVHYTPYLELDFVVSRNLRSVTQEPIVVGDLLVYVNTNRDQSEFPSATTSDEPLINARLDRVFLQNLQPLAAQTGSQWEWNFGRTALSDAGKYSAGAKESSAIRAYAIVARGTPA